MYTYDSDELIELAGTYWSQISDDPLFATIVETMVALDEQTEEDKRTFIDCCQRETVPLYRHVFIEPFTLKRSDEKDLSWPVQHNLVAINCIADRISPPTTTLIDYDIRNKRIHFKQDPFVLFKQNGQELKLWLHGVSYDERYMSDIWGAAVGLTAQSSVEFNDTVNLVYDALINGTSRQHIKRLLDCSKIDYNLYEPNQPLTNEQVPFITIPGSFLSHEIGWSLTFDNKEVPVQVKDGKVEFSMTGDVEAIRKFWMIINKRKTEDGKTLFELLKDQKTINPMRFILDNVLSSNVLLCTVKGLKSGIDNELLRKLLPPHEALIVINI